MGYASRERRPREDARHHSGSQSLDLTHGFSSFKRTGDPQFRSYTRRPAGLRNRDNVRLVPIRELIQVVGRARAGGFTFEGQRRRTDQAATDAGDAGLTS